MIAEGVETNEQLHLLRRLGCSLGQGFPWSPAVPASELIDVLGRLRKPQPSRQREPRAAAASSADGFVTAGAPGLPADIAGRIMALRSAGSSPSSIAATLNAARVRSPRGTRWQRSSSARVIAERTLPAGRFAQSDRQQAVGD